jgi:putative nucleotidyltransferase with HDIG domain
MSKIEAESSAREMKKLLERINELEESLEYEKQLNKNLEKEIGQLRKTLEQTIMIMVNIAEMKDPFTVGHQKRVSQLATAIAKKMYLPEEKVEAVRVASLIHDIGKVAVPSEILNKPAKLTESEFALVKNHPLICYKCVKDVHFPRKVADIILQHHEKVNGTGYPNGLHKKDILLEARIVSVADVVESMNAERPYRHALGIEKALDEISKNKGKLYDPAVVDCCIKVFKEDKFQFKDDLNL